MPTIRQEAEQKRAAEARAWIAGGSAPYQAAKHTGFRSVGEMMDAIKRLDDTVQELTDQINHQAEKASDRVPAVQRKFGPAPAETPEHPTEVPAAAPFPPKRSQTFMPDAMLRVGCFNVQHFTDGSRYKDEIRVYMVGSEGFIVFDRADLLRLANQLNVFNDLLEEQTL